MSNLKSETLKILEPYSWWLQAVQVSPDSHDAREILGKADNFFLDAENDEIRKRLCVSEAKNLCTGEKQNYVKEDGSYISRYNLSAGEIEREKEICGFIFNRQDVLKALVFTYGFNALVKLRKIS